MSDPARVTYSPSIQYLPFGMSGVVRCFIQASPPFQFVIWTKDRRKFDPNEHYGVIALSNGSLEFQRVSHESQGRYRCTPYNLHGTAGGSTVMEVLVRGIHYLQEFLSQLKVNFTKTTEIQKITLYLKRFYNS
jgi:hypothetical protein